VSSLGRCCGSPPLASNLPPQKVQEALRRTFRSHERMLKRLDIALVSLRDARHRVAQRRSLILRFATITTVKDRALFVWNCGYALAFQSSDGFGSVPTMARGETWSSRAMYGRAACQRVSVRRASQHLVDCREKQRARQWNVQHQPCKCRLLD
jgi:hypothetical protein